MVRPYLFARFALITILGSPAMSQEPIVHGAVNVDPDPGPPGEKPYEMADREEARTPLFHFDDVEEILARTDCGEVC